MSGPSRCGYVALVGAPNAGKSTLLNQLLGTKLSIVSPKVQTTRTRLLGILVDGESQLILVDTPGIFAPKRRLERAMVAAAWAGAEDADVVVVLVDAAHGIEEDTRRILDGLLALAAAVLVVGFVTRVLGVRELLMLAAPVAQLAFYRPRYRRGLTSRDCVVLTHLGTAMLVLFLAGTALWARAGLPENVWL